jgi:hypothetical protein
MRGQQQATGSNWKQFLLNSVHAYFSPLTGAINGIWSELKKKY